MSSGYAAFLFTRINFSIPPLPFCQPTRLITGEGNRMTKTLAKLPEGMRPEERRSNKTLCNTTGDRSTPSLQNAIEPIYLSGPGFWAKGGLPFFHFRAFAEASPHQNQKKIRRAKNFQRRKQKRNNPQFAPGIITGPLRLAWGGWATSLVTTTGSHSKSIIKKPAGSKNRRTVCASLVISIPSLFRTCS